MTDQEILALHRSLVDIPSLSHQEQEIAEFVFNLLAPFSTRIERWGNNVVAWTGVGAPLLLNSHLDTVPPGEGWATDPFTSTVEDGKVFGLGANDTKASVAAMMAAFIWASYQESACEVVLMLVPEEETGGRGTEIAWPKLRDEEGWIPQGAVVGEPTELMVGTEQKGMMVLELIAHGQACHAANAKKLGITNPVWQLTRDLGAIRDYPLGPEHPELGSMTLEPTVISAAATSNQVAEQAKAVLDLRTLPGSDHQVIFNELSTVVTGELRARSLRLAPYRCPAESKIVEAALLSHPFTKTFASATMSDQVFFQDIPTIKCGPGVSARSHTLNEYVMENEILAGARFYRSLITNFAKVAR